MSAEAPHDWHHPLNTRGSRVGQRSKHQRCRACGIWRTKLSDAAPCWKLVAS